MKKIILILLCLLLIPVVLGGTAFYVEKGEPYTLKFSCEKDGTDCSTNANCNITIVYLQNSTTIADNNASNLNNGLFAFELDENQTNINGEFSTRVMCIDGGLNDTASFIYEVNPTGIRPSEQKTAATTRGIWFFVIIAILLFLGFMFVNQKVPVKWTFFGLSVIFFLISINLLFIGIQDEVVNPRLEGFFEGFTVISWYFYWFVGGLLIIMWAFTFINTWFYRKNLNNARRFGLG